MRRQAKKFMGFGALLGASAFAPLGQSAVNTPEERREKIEIAEKLLDRNVVLADEGLVAMIGDPFAVLPKPIVRKVEKPKEEVVLTESELIPLLANNVKPAGIVAIGGEYYLLLKNSKLKSGDSVPVKYQEVEYNLEIVNVLRNGYSLRLGDAEVEIKLK